MCIPLSNIGKIECIVIWYCSYSNKSVKCYTGFVVGACNLQAVIVCCRHKKLSLARQVFDRLWKDNTAADEKVVWQHGVVVTR